ncbi:MAG: insulinase family protein, partial [Acidobacteriota bacterium]|nr:insulinase family protein [Acidobacteriota bacterium]
KGYTYGVHTSFDCRRWPGPFAVQGSVQADATVESVQEVLGQMEAIGGTLPVTSEELNLARAALTKGFARGFETAGQIARGVAQLVQHDLPADEYDRFITRVDQVDVAEVTLAAATHLRVDRAAVVVVGPAEQVAEGLATLGLGEPLRLEA